MSDVQSLADLKALAEAEDNPNPKATAEVVEAEELEEPEDEQADTEEQSEDEGEPEAEAKDETEDWAKPDGAVPVRTHVEMKHKLKGKLHEAENENAELKARLAAYESGQAVVNTQNEPELKKPSRSDPDIDYDEEIYEQKLADYLEAKVVHNMASRDRKQASHAQQTQQEQQVRGEVDKHYERAAELVSSGKITAENYQAADHIVRKAMANSLPGMGEIVLDNMIADLGPGSEKVIYHLGVNPAALSEYLNKLKNSPTGFAAASYLGKLADKFNSSQINKLSNAPKPDTPLKGTASVASASAKSAYLKAEKAGDISAMLAAKRTAKAKGQDTSKW